jgi:hypothetical protein
MKGRTMERSKMKKASLVALSVLALILITALFIPAPKRAEARWPCYVEVLVWDDNNEVGIDDLQLTGEWLGAGGVLIEAFDYELSNLGNGVYQVDTQEGEPPPGTEFYRITMDPAGGWAPVFPQTNPQVEPMVDWDGENSFTWFVEVQP